MSTGIRPIMSHSLHRLRTICFVMGSMMGSASTSCHAMAAAARCETDAVPRVSCCCSSTCRGSEGAATTGHGRPGGVNLALNGLASSCHYTIAVTTYNPIAGAEPGRTCYSCLSWHPHF